MQTNGTQATNDMTTQSFKFDTRFCYKLITKQLVQKLFCQYSNRCSCKVKISHAITLNHNILQRQFVDYIYTHTHRQVYFLIKNINTILQFPTVFVFLQSSGPVFHTSARGESMSWINQVCTLLPDHYMKIWHGPIWGTYQHISHQNLLGQYQNAATWNIIY